MMEADPQERLCEGGAAAVLNMEPGSSISVAYHPQFGPHDDLMLLEVDEKLLPDVLHQRVTLRGQQDEDAVLCTESKTYAVKFVGTSNSVFLVPPSEQYEVKGKCGGELGAGGKARASVLKVAQGSMELVEIAPRIDKLKNLLLERLYMSSDVEMGDSGEEMEAGLYSWGDLVEMVQASDEELRRGLEALSAVEIDGYWRVVDEQYMDLILNMLLHNIVLNDWSVDALDESEVIEALKSDGFSQSLSRHCLKMYGNKADPDPNLGSNIWSLEEKKVCVHFARKVLSGGKKKMDAFMEEWGKKIPKGMRGSFDMLEGEVLTEQFGIDTWVRSFSRSSLPYNPTERFAILFKERVKWEFKDLQPYIRDLSVPGSSLEDLLLKYTRRTQASMDSEPAFTAR